MPDLAAAPCFTYSAAMVLRLQLRCHPDTPCDPLSGIEAEVARVGSRLALRFLARGDIAALALPSPRDRPERSDGLWAHTCFETFVRAGASSVYHEVNLAPSGNWACYRFADYREGMADAPLALAPEIGFGAGDDSAELNAAVELKGAGIAEEDIWRVGLSAVIEERSGRISYWALNHPPGKPDFHHQDCFALEFSPARSS